MVGNSRNLHCRTRYLGTSNVNGMLSTEYYTFLIHPVSGGVGGPDEHHSVISPLREAKEKGTPKSPGCMGGAPGKATSAWTGVGASSGFAVRNWKVRRCTGVMIND